MGILSDAAIFLTTEEHPPPQLYRPIKKRTFRGLVGRFQICAVAHYTYLNNYNGPIKVSVDIDGHPLCALRVIKRYRLLVALEWDLVPRIVAAKAAWESDAD
jgi:hypothetical protein